MGRAGKKERPETLAKKRRRLFDEAARLSEVDGIGADEAFGPFNVAEAASLVDMLDVDAGTDGFSWFERMRDREDFMAAAEEAELRRMEITLRALFRHAVYLACLAQPVKAAVSRRDSWIAMGIRWDWGHHAESNAHCLFCDDNLVTLGERRKRKERRIPAAIVMKFDKHTQTCAMRYLLKVRADCQNVAPPASTDRAAAEVST